MIRDLDKKQTRENIAREKAITILRAEILQTMKRSFTADFCRRIPVALHPIQHNLAEVRDNFSISSSAANFIIIAFKQQVQFLTDQLASTTTAQTRHTEMLDELDRTMFELSIHVRDLYISFNNFIDDAKKAEYMVKKGDKSQRRDETEKEERIIAMNRWLRP